MSRPHRDPHANPFCKNPLNLSLNGLSKFSLTSLLAVLSGCSGLTPDYTRPALPVAAQWGGAAPAVLPVAVNEALSFKNTPFATDPVLKPLLAMAIANNRDLRVAVLNIELAQAQLGVLDHLGHSHLLPRGLARSNKAPQHCPQHQQSDRQGHHQL